MRQKLSNEPDEGVWVVILALIKPVMLVLIGVFAIMCFVTSIELHKLSSANLTRFIELAASSTMMIPMLITIVGLYATYHMHKSTMIIFYGLVILHVIFSVAFLIFALTDDCFEETMRETIMQRNSTMRSYSIDIYNESKPIYEWSQYEETWAIDKIQKGLSCCGMINNKHDWNQIMDEKYKLGNIYPKSCCKKPYTDYKAQRIYCQSDDNIFEDSCKEQLKSVYLKLLFYMGILCILQAFMALGAQIISFKVQEPAIEKPRNPAEIAWMQFVNAQYKADAKSRSKSCV